MDGRERAGTALAPAARRAHGVDDPRFAHLAPIVLRGVEGALRAREAPQREVSPRPGREPPGDAGALEAIDSIKPPPRSHRRAARERPDPTRGGCARRTALSRALVTS